MLTIILSALAILALLLVCLTVAAVQFRPHKHSAQRRLDAIATENARHQRANGF